MTSAPEKPLLDAAVETLKERYPGWTGPVTAAYAPGRANLFGEHAECTAGFLLPVCLELGTAVVGAKRSVGPAEVQLFSAAAQQAAHWDGKVTKIDAEDQGTWRGLVKGCVLTFGEGYQEKEGRAFECPAFSAVITSNVPQRSGLASSASLTVAFMTFLEELSGCRFKPEKKAQLCLAATRDVAGAQCGIIDHFAAAMGKHGNAILVDYRTLSSVCYPTGNGAVKVLVTKTGANPTLSAAGYAQRLTCCTEALQAVNASSKSAMKTLSDAELSAVEALDGSISEGAIRCARHVITENQRCQGAAAAFKAKDYATVGKLMLSSHESLKNDYQASCAELDTLVDLAMAQQGVWGSRAMGAGLGAACIVSLVQADRVDEVKAALSEGYQAKFQSSCEHTASDACAGARRVDMALYFKEQHGYECIVQANVLKAQGNEFFKAGECRKALEKYNRIPLAIKGLIKKQGDGAGDGAGGMGMMGMQNKDEQALTDEERTEVMKLWHTCHINRAMCYIKLENWEKGVAACTEAINAGCEDNKAFFRRGKCYRHLGELDKAREELNYVATRDPNDANVQRELLEVEKRQKVQDVKAKKTFAKMFA